MNILPRISLGCYPTPLHRLDNISRLCHANIYIKRDDLCGVGLGGNKVRKLEYLLREAKDQGARLVFTTGGAQSNHAMLTAACCNKLGMKCILILKKRGVLEKKGNLFLEDLLGTEVRFMDTNDYADIYREMDRVGLESGLPYYKIPCGGSNGLGALGYIDGMKEVADTGLHFDRVICAVGSGGTLAGVAMGTKMYLPGTVVNGMAVDTDPFDTITPAIMREAAGILGIDFDPTGTFTLTDMCGPGYSIPSPEGNRAVRLMAEQEGIILDTTYTGKAFAGLLALGESGAFREDENVLFIHTGGAGGLFSRDDL